MIIFKKSNLSVKSSPTNMGTANRLLFLKMNLEQDIIFLE